MKNSQAQLARCMSAAVMVMALLAAPISAQDHDVVILNGRVMDPETGFDAVANVGIATDDMFTEDLVVPFASANPGAYDDEGYMIDAFNRGATGSGELAKILAAITDEMWKRGYSNEDLAKIYGGNMMRVYKQVWR